MRVVMGVCKRLMMYMCVLWAGSPAAKGEDAATVDDEDGSYNNPYRTSPIISNHYSRTIHPFIDYSFSTATSSAWQSSL